jgi:hypothetical protein
MKSTEFKRSPGKRKVARSDKNCARSGKPPVNLAGHEQIRNEANRRWPTVEQQNLYFELNTSKNPVNRPSKGRIKPPVNEFALLESVDPVTLDKLLTAASLRVKRVKRYPGYIIQRTYNLKNRPIQII